MNLYRISNQSPYAEDEYIVMAETEEQAREFVRESIRQAYRDWAKNGYNLVVTAKRGGAITMTPKNPEYYKKLLELENDSLDNFDEKFKSVETVPAVPGVCFK